MIQARRDLQHWKSQAHVCVRKKTSRKRIHSENRIHCVSYTLNQRMEITAVAERAALGVLFVICPTPKLCITIYMEIKASSMTYNK